MGFAAGFQTGWNAVEAGRKRRKQEEVQSIYKEGMAKAKAEADASGGTAFDAAQYQEATELTGQGRQQADMLRKQDEAFGTDAIRATQQGLDSAQGSPEYQRQAQSRLAAEQDALAAKAPVSTMGLPAQAPIEETVLPGSVSAVDQATPARYEALAVASRTPGAVPAEITQVAPQEVPAAEPMPGPQQGLPARRAAEEVTQIQKPKYDAMQIFHQKYAPAVASKLAEQGNLEGAQAFETWSKTAKGAAYGEKWMGAMMKSQFGDDEGAAQDMIDLYNTMIPDGQYATLGKGKDGQYLVEVRSEGDNKVIGSHAADIKQLSQLGVGMLTPMKAFEMAENKATAAQARADKLADKEMDHQHTLEVEMAKLKNRPDKVQMTVIEDDKGAPRRVMVNMDTQEVVKDLGPAPRNELGQVLAVMANARATEDQAMQRDKVNNAAAQATAVQNAVPKQIGTYQAGPNKGKPIMGREVKYPNGETVQMTEREWQDEKKRTRKDMPVLKK